MADGQPESAAIVPEAVPLMGQQLGASQAFDPVAAVQYGLLIEAVYSMYYAQPTNPTPPTQSDFPSGFRLLAWGHK